MIEQSQIIGICLLRNEEYFLKRAITNIVDFCDKIIIAVHQSKDGTLHIAQELEMQFDSVSCHSIAHPRESHALIQPYCGTPTWIFGVDGDEIYDPAGLRLLRSRLFDGIYDDGWAIFGNVLNCVALDLKTNIARGYLAPPCRSMTKLYNFNAINHWSDVEGQRLHGGKIIFKKGWDQTKRLPLFDEKTWEEAIFRCLHLCFLPRSSLDAKVKHRLLARRNTTENLAKGRGRTTVNQIKKLLNFSLTSDWKIKKYMRGIIVEKNVAGFFP